MRSLVGLAAAMSAIVWAGCIHHEETVYQDVPRASVQFENDKAARLFYESYHQERNRFGRPESKTEVHIPVVFDHKRRVLSGENIAFNAAITTCDTDRNALISEQEAKLFSELVRKH
jgi:hypothetical protein